MYDEPFAELIANSDAIWCQRWRGSTSRWRCLAMLVTSCSAATIGMSGADNSTLGFGRDACSAQAGSGRAAGCDLAGAGRQPRAMAQPLLPSRLHVRRAGDQAAKLARIIGSTTLDHMYQLLCSIDSDPSQTVIQGEESANWSTDEMGKIAVPLDPLDRMTLADSLSYLTDDILQKVDRAAMAVGLETRVPFLDKDVVEFAAGVPPEMKVREGRGKWLVRQVLYQHVPAALVDRPKTGFSIPLDDWLRGPLKSWAYDLLSPERLQRQGLFNARRVADKLAEHMSGSRNHGYWLWNVLMAQAWHDLWCGD